MFSFAYPWLVFALPLPWLLRKLMPPRCIEPLAVRVPFGDRIRDAAGADSVLTQSVGTRKLLLPWLFWLLLLTAAARPQWLEAPLTRELPARDLLLLVDLSGSMRQEDFTNAAGAKVDRLTAVKEVLGDFLTKRDGDRVGLVVFGDAPFLQAPFSTDLHLSRQLLDQTEIGMAGPRTAFGDAIGLGINLFEQSNAPSKTIIALTDGNDTASQVPPVEAARIAKQRAIRIHTVAIGDPTTAGEEKLDEETLHNVAEMTGGSYFFAGDRQQLNGIYEQLDRTETRQVNVVSYRPRHELYYWPVLLVLLLSIANKLVVLVRASQGAAKVQNFATVKVDPRSGRLEIRL